MLFSIQYSYYSFRSHHDNCWRVTCPCITKATANSMYIICFDLSFYQSWPNSIEMVAKVQTIKHANRNEIRFVLVCVATGTPSAKSAFTSHWFRTLLLHYVWLFSSPSNVLSTTEYLPSPVKLLKRKASGMTHWINTQLSILSMQIEIEVLHLSLDFRKAQWKTWYMHPFPLAIYFLWKDDSYITVSQKFEANTWQPSSIFFHWVAEIGDPTDITEFTLFPLLLVCALLLSSEGLVWPPTLCCYFQYEISTQGLLDASLCLFFTPPTWLSLNARQIEHFWNWHLG